MAEDWIKVQVKTFTKWCNSHLAKRGMEVTDLQTSFQDGTLLVNLLEVIGKESFGDYNRKPKIKMAKIENLNKCLEYIKNRKVQLHSIGATDIYDGNLKLILGIMWTLILRFQISDISVEELTAKEALLLWCRRKTEGYDGFSVKDFTWSFQNGLAFCALIHCHRPDLLDYDGLNKDQHAENLKKAFDIAEKELSIPRYLEVEDMLEIKPDERSVMTYLSEYFKHFSKGAKSEHAGRRISKVIGVIKTLEEYENEYVKTATNLISEFNNEVSRFSFIKFKNTPEDVKEKHKDYVIFKKTLKPVLYSKKFNLRILLDGIQFKRKHSNRPIYVPPADCNFGVVNDSWKSLVHAEKDYAEKLLAEHIRQKELQRLYSKHQSMKLEVIVEITDIREYIAVKEFIESISDAERVLKIFNLKMKEFDAQVRLIDEWISTSSILIDKNHYKTNEINEEINNINSQKEEIGDELKVKGERLSRELEHQKKLDTLRLDFAKKGKEYIFWKKSCEEATQSLTAGTEIETVRKFNNILLKWIEDETKRSDKKLQYLVELDNELVNLGSSNNEYAPFKIQEIIEIAASLMKVFALKKTDYYAELYKQEENDKARRDFAFVADQFNMLIEEKMNFLDKVFELKTEPVEKLRTTKEALIFEGVEMGFLELSEKNKRCKALQIVENNYTVWDFPTLENKKVILIKRYEDMVQFINQEIEFSNRQLILNEEKSGREELMSALFTLVNEINIHDKKVRSCIDYMKEEIFAETVEEAKEILSIFSQKRDLAKSEGPSFEKNKEKYLELIEKAGKDVYKIDLQKIIDNVATFEIRIVEYEKMIKVIIENLELIHGELRNHTDLCSALKEELDSIDTVTSTAVELEEELARINRLIAKLESLNPKISEIEKIEISLEERSVFVDQTKTNYNELSNFHQKISDTLHKKKLAIEAEILAEKGSKVSKEQIEEFKRLFQLFDKEKKGSLFQYEFSAVLNALGDEISDSEVKDVFFKYDTSKKGSLDFDNFVTFMVDRVEDTHSKAQMIESWKVIAEGQDFVTLLQMKKANVKKETIDYFKSKISPLPDKPDCYDYMLFVNL